MSLFFASLNSGSNGNCYYIGNADEAVLIDAGISCSETEKRLANLDLSMKNVKAIFISHEHTDHISGTTVLCTKYNLPVYITPLTLQRAAVRIEKHLQRTFNPDEHVTIGGLKITPFVKLHDARDPYSFIIEYHGTKVSVITDIGKACDRVIHYFRQSHACFLESNYDEKMLEEGAYPNHLKKRIRGNRGHLSNTQALELFLAHKPTFMSHLFLSHLSKQNNRPELVLDLFTKHAGHTQILVASRDQETPLYSISKASIEPNETVPPVLKYSNIQLNLFNQ
jgi:phosphoribosyl 1,2-cyclic phosphodiesterase